MNQVQRSLLLVFVAAWLWWPACVLYADGPEPVPRFEPVPCSFPLPANQSVQCGYLVVPEDRARPAGRAIRLAVAILKSRAPSPKPDPLIFLNGGPGAQALQDLPRLFGIYESLLADLDRDVIVFDQRGVGLSQPALECPELAPVLLAQAQGQVFAPAQEQEPYLACRDRWLAQGIDLAAYTTAASAADVNDLWQTLGYVQANLFGVSYGTVLAETVMRDYPAGIRSAILDSAYPLQIDLQADMAANVSAYFERVFARCAADRFCRVLYPKAAAMFYDLLARLTEVPVQLTMRHPSLAAPFTFRFDGAALVDVARSVPYRQLPALVYDLSEDNYTAVFEFQKAAIDNLLRYGTPPARAMAYSIICSQGIYARSPGMEHMASYPEAVWTKQYVDHVLLPLPCEKWPTAAELDVRPAVSSIPTLVLLGEFDQTVSLDYARLFNQDLSQSLVITVPNTGHGVMANAGLCANNLARAFLDDPARLPPADCLARTGRPVLEPPFLVRAAVMRRPVQVMSVLVGLGLGLMAGMAAIAWHRAAVQLGFAWRRSSQLVGWRVAAGSAGLLGLGWAASRAGWLPIEPVRIVPLLLPLLAALSAAFVFSPEDEPALEVLLAAPRPLALTLVERLAVLFLWQGSIGLLASLYVAPLAGESVASNVMRWLPPLVGLSGLAVYVTLVTRRAMYGVLLASLVWLVFAVFGDMIVARWPFAWPLHIYLQPDQAEYGLNRLFVCLAGAGLVALTAPRLLHDEERLLLGKRRSKAGRVTTSRPNGRNAGAAALPWAGSRDGLRWGNWLMPLGQIAAMVRYELLMQWRRVALPALGLGMITPALLGAVLARNKFGGVGEALATGALSPETASANITAELLLVTWLGAFLTVMVMLPLVVADTIPQDRHLGVHEVLDSLPLKPGTYLAGKVLGLWVSLMVGLATAALLIAGAWRLAVGPFDLAVYAELWLVGVLPTALIQAGLAALLAAGQPTNRRAMLAGGAWSLLCLFGIGLAFVTYGTFWDWLNPARPAVWLYYLVGWPGAMRGKGVLSQSALNLIGQFVNQKRAIQSLGAGLGQVGLVWLWVWLRRRRK